MSNDTETLTFGDFLHARITVDENAAQYATEASVKRQLLELHHPEVDEIGDLWCSTCLSPSSHYGAPWPCATLRIVATIYADHPDYRDDWRP